MIRWMLKTYWILKSQLGVDPVKFMRSFGQVARYVRDLRKFRSGYSGRLEILPCLHDWREQAGAIKSEYFWQDLIVARKVFLANPVRHVDVGSRIDGFIAHVASFREVEVFDVRPITKEIPGIAFKQVDFMQYIDNIEAEYCDSLSCLHALEHFGLGRYGDPIDPRGFELGLTNLARLLKARGRLYLSVPIGRERVEFNANRVFYPKTITNLCESLGLDVKELTIVNDDQIRVLTESEIFRADEYSQNLYSLGIFLLEKRPVDGKETVHVV